MKDIIVAIPFVLMALIYGIFVAPHELPHDTPVGLVPSSRVVTPEIDTAVIYDVPESVVTDAATGVATYTSTKTGNTARIRNFENFVFAQSADKLNWNQRAIIDVGSLPEAGLDYSNLQGTVDPIGAGTLTVIVPPITPSGPTEPRSMWFTPTKGFMGEVELTFTAIDGDGEPISSAAVPFVLTVHAPKATGLIPSARPPENKPVDPNDPLPPAAQLPELPRATVDTAYDRNRWPYAPLPPEALQSPNRSK